MSSAGGDWPAIASSPARLDPIVGLMRLGDFELALPPGWEEHTLRVGDATLYTFIAPRTNHGSGLRWVTQGFRSSLVFHFGVAGHARALAVETSHAIERARRNFGAIEPRIAPGPMIVDVPSTRVIYEFSEPGGPLPLLQAQYLAAIEGTLLSVFFTTAAIEATTLLPDLERMIGALALRLRNR